MHRKYKLVKLYMYMYNVQLWISNFLKCTCTFRVTKKPEMQLALSDWIERWLVWGFAQWESEKEKLLAW